MLVLQLRRGSRTASSALTLALVLRRGCIPPADADGAVRAERPRKAGREAELTPGPGRRPSDHLREHLVRAVANDQLHLARQHRVRHADRLAADRVAALRRLARAPD